MSTLLIRDLYENRDLRHADMVVARGGARRENIVFRSGQSLPERDLTGASIYVVSKSYGMI
jgi:hypothetical protein